MTQTKEKKKTEMVTVKKAVLKVFRIETEEQVEEANEFLKAHRVLKDGVHISDGKAHILYFVDVEEEQEVEEEGQERIYGLSKEEAVNVMERNLAQAQNNLMAHEYERLKAVSADLLNRGSKNTKQANAEAVLKWEKQIEADRSEIRTMINMIKRLDSGEFTVS